MVGYTEYRFTGYKSEQVQIILGVCCKHIVLDIISMCVYMYIYIRRHSYMHSKYIKPYTNLLIKFQINTFNYVIYKNLSDMFPIRNGLKQGDVVSPLLFNFALEYAIRRVQVN